MWKPAYVCPNCRHELRDPVLEFFNSVSRSRVTCQECGASVIIEDDVPRLPREDEPD